MTSLKNLSRNKHRIIALQEQTATRSLHISITKRFITTTIQTIVWQFRVLLTSFMLSLVLKFFKRKSNKSHIRTVNVAVLNDTTVRMTWKKNINRCSLTATKTKQRMEWHFFRKQFEIIYFLSYLFPRNYTASGISFFKRIRRLLQILFFRSLQEIVRPFLNRIVERFRIPPSSVSPKNEAKHNEWSKIWMNNNTSLLLFF